MTNPLEKLNSETIGKVYDDLAHPALQETGNALGTVFGMLNVLVAPLERWRLESKAKTERFKQDLAERYNKIPQEKVVEPSLNIVARSLEAIKYNLDEEQIRDYFLNLLASSMNADKASAVHPSFVNKALELSAHDANIFNELYRNGPSLPVVKVRIQEKSDDNSLFANGFENAKYLNKTITAGVDIYQHVLNLPSLNGIENLYNNAVSLHILSQLGFIDITYNRTLTLDGYYTPFDTLYEWDSILQHYKKNDPVLHDEKNILVLIPGKLQVTPIGQQFGYVCCQQ